MSVFDDIPLSHTFALTREIAEGMSGDRKYYIETHAGKKLLLRVCDAAQYNTKRKDMSNLHKLYQAGLPVPMPVASGPCEGGKSIYLLLQWMEGTEAERTVPLLPPSEQYAFGVRSGEILRGIHRCTEMPHAENWRRRYFAVLEPRLAAYRERGVPFEGADTVLQFIAKNAALLDTRPQCRLHGDYHLGNMVVNGDGELFIIDWQTVDFDGAADGWYDFTRLALQYPAVAAGQIDGYFGGSVPQDFWRVLALYLAASGITSILWIKRNLPHALEETLQHNRETAQFLAATSDFVPAWYTQCKQALQK
ncbi:MAG: phosphotransferase [Oscillospiraceae bacterium]|nr:phosphotransferase [Oscillospiraceae bacterium]